MSEDKATEENAQQLQNLRLPRFVSRGLGCNSDQSDWGELSSQVSGDAGVGRGSLETGGDWESQCR